MEDEGRKEEGGKETVDRLGNGEEKERRPECWGTEATRWAARRLDPLNVRQSIGGHDVLLPGQNEQFHLS